MTSASYSFLILLLVIGYRTTMAQSTHLLMLSVDNDLFAGRGQDGAYTSGLRIDYFIERQNKMNRPVVINHFGVRHIMITPNDISNVTPELGDYPYSGLLSLIYSKGIIDPHRRRSITTESVVGILGPYSFAGDMQTQVHKMLGNSLPQGWESQYGTSVLANVNCAVEVGMPRMPKGVEVILQSKLYLGTILTAAALQGMLKFGKMPPHFKSFASRYTSGQLRRFQWYGFISQQVNAIASNTMLTDRRCRNSEDRVHQPPISHGVIHSSYGVNLSYADWGVSFEYKTHSGLVQGQPIKAYGSIVIYFSP